MRWWFRTLVIAVFVARFVRNVRVNDPELPGDMRAWLRGRNHT
jgi:hypothetical protein